MFGHEHAVTLWLDQNYIMPSVVYLDAHCLRVFLNWLQADSARIQQFAEQHWNIVVFTEQLRRLYPWQHNKRLWRDSRQVSLAFDELRSRSEDRTFVGEVLMTYFHGQIQYQSQAEFLTLVRQRTIGERAHVLSQNLSFRRVPEMDTFFVPDQTMDGIHDLPAQFDFFQDMRLHRQLQSVVDNQLANGLYPDAVVEACKLLFTYMRQIDPSLTSDGGTLADEALKLDLRPDHGQLRINGPLPSIHLNDLQNPSELGEQRGYYQFCAGITDAFRNLNAHHSATDPFIIARFGDKRKALKALCFISLILEKLDQRVSPWTAGP